MRFVEAEYSDGVLKPSEHLSLRAGERVSLIVVRRPDPRRWDLARLAQPSQHDDQDLAEQGLTDWGDALDAEDQR